MSAADGERIQTGQRMFRAIARKLSAANRRCQNPDEKLRVVCERVFPSSRRGRRSERSATQTVVLDLEFPQIAKGRRVCTARALAPTSSGGFSFRVDAFSSRESGSTSLEKRSRLPKATSASIEPAAVPYQFQLLGRKRAEAGRGFHRALRIHCSAPRSNWYKSRRNRGVTFACSIS